MVTNKFLCYFSVRISPLTNAVAVCSIMCTHKSYVVTRCEVTAPAEWTRCTYEQMLCVYVCVCACVRACTPVCVCVFVSRPQTHWENVILAIDISDDFVY